MRHRIARCRASRCIVDSIAIDIRRNIVRIGVGVGVVRSGGERRCDARREYVGDHAADHAVASLAVVGAARCRVVRAARRRIARHRAAEVAAAVVVVWIVVVVVVVVSVMMIIAHHHCVGTERSR